MVNSSRDRRCSVSYKMIDSSNIHNYLFGIIKSLIIIILNLKLRLHVELRTKHTVEIFEAINDNGLWKRRKNEEIKYNKPTVVTETSS